MDLTWEIKTFQALNPGELYAILRLRSEVFVVEQRCIFQDIDNKDQACLHLMGWRQDLLVAYTRIVPQGVSYTDYPSIGRVVTSPAARGGGLGRVLMEKSISELENAFGIQPIKIGAQVYLKSFYESLGFVQAGDIYDEDGIDHLSMVRQPVRKS